MNQKTIASNVIKHEAEELLRASDRLDAPVNKAAEIIQNSSGKIVLCGIGKSGYVAQKISATLCSTGTRAVFMHAAEAIHGDLGIYDRGDPTILISKSGSTEEIIRLIPILKAFGSPIIAMVGNIDSPLAQHADVILDASIRQEADPLGIVPTSSTTLAMAIGDALAAVLMTAKKVCEEDFAMYHPGGQLGKNLLLKVSDVMHPLAKIATVNKSDSLREIAIRMTHYPLGGAIVLGDENKLEGIITDGDLRRCLAKIKDIDSLYARDIMTINPICINNKQLLKDALIIMEDRSSQISVLPVVDDSDNSCLGLVRLHDVYRTKIS